MNASPSSRQANVAPASPARNENEASLLVVSDGGRVTIVTVGAARSITAVVAGSTGTAVVVFCGVTTEVCVQTSMREGNDRGYVCLVVEDGTESYFPEFKAQALAMIAAQGAIVGWHAPSASLLRAIEVAGEVRPAPA